MKDQSSKNHIEEIQKNFQKLFHNFNSKNNLNSINDLVSKKDSESVKDKKDCNLLERIQNFKMKPKEISSYLDNYVIQQKEAKKVLSVTICDHYNHVRKCLKHPSLLKQEYNKPNTIILGPTGVGKTYLMRKIAKLIGVPFIKADATKFSETGYIGSDVEDLVRDLVKTANGNIELAQYGIIYIDEIDKIASEHSSQGKDVSGRGVQINLLKLMEETEVNLLSSTDMMGQMQAMMDFSHGENKLKKRTINTRHILFIVSGAFERLSKDIKKRIEKKQIGFDSFFENQEKKISNYLKHIKTIDFIKYGFEPEFIGRLPVRVACESLDKKDLANILRKSEGNILKQYIEDFIGYGIAMKITDNAIIKIAENAANEKTGARGLVTILEKLLRNFKFELPSTKVKNFTISSYTILNPNDALNKLLNENKDFLNNSSLKDIKVFIEDFYKKNNITIMFNQEAVEAILSESRKKNQNLYDLCKEKFKNYQHGLAIIYRNNQNIHFVINKTAVNSPNKELSKWIKDSFEKEKN